ncbi:MAG: hypothetical protein V4732_20120 [Pseudomonadota bacterium]
MKYIFLLIFFISQSSLAEWVQGLYKISCVPEIGFYEITKSQIPGPNVEDTLRPASKNFNAKLYSQLEQQGIFPSNQQISKTCTLRKNLVIEFISHAAINSKDNGTFEVKINNITYINNLILFQKQMYLSTLVPAKYVYFEFEKFLIYNDLWIFRGFLQEESEFRLQKGFSVNLTEEIAAPRVSLPVSYETLEKMYVNTLNGGKPK